MTTSNKSLGRPLAAVALASIVAASAFGGVPVQTVGPRAGTQASLRTTARATDAMVPLAVDTVVPFERSNRIGRADPNRKLDIAVSIPYADPAGAERFADSVSDPSSPDFRHFITPEEVGARFGVSQERVQRIADYLTAHGLKVTFVSKNRLAVLCEGTVAQAEKAFGTTIDEYQVDPLLAPAVEGGNTHFIAPTTPLHAPASIAGDILDVFGLDTYVKPMPRTALTPAQTRTLYNAAPIYSAGNTGLGRVCAISNFDGFRLTNVPLLYSHWALPTPAGGVGSNVHTVVVGTGAGTGAAAGEGDLDIQMVLGMAPLCEFYIYDSTSNLVGVLTREVSDNLADTISESYGWNITASTATSAHNQHVSMSAQGITYMCASGDSGTTLEPYSYPDYDPEVLMVGGTVATVTGAGVRTGEVGWNGSGGGWSTKAVAFNVRPSWQVGTGVNTSINYRMVPDISLQAAGSGGTGAYPFYYNGALDSTSVGTSFSSPVFCGMVAIAEQKLIGLNSLPANAAGKRRLGRMQNVIYAQNGRTDVWYDITSGANGTLPNGTASSCGVKYDMVTGWGAMNVDAFVASQTVAPCPADVNGDHVVDGTDLATLLAQWFSIGSADLNHDGGVDANDLAILLAGWGACP